MEGHGMLIPTDEMRSELGHIHGEADTNLILLRDFHVFTGHSYGSYDEGVKDGQIKGIVANGRTGTTFEAKYVAHLLLQYLDEELPQVVLYQLVSYFESFFFDLLKVLLMHNPRALPPGRQLTVKDVLDKAGWKELVMGMIDEELHKQQYRNVREWFEFLGSVLNTDPVPERDIDRLAELKASRDLLAHNQGRVNDTYIKKSGRLARSRTVGDKLAYDRKYVYDAGDFLTDFVTNIMKSVYIRFPEPAAK